MAAVILQPPDETFDGLGQAVHARDIVGEFLHARIVERIFDPRDVELGQVLG
jgi:hypothetical protein